MSKGTFTRLMTGEEKRKEKSKEITKEPKKETSKELVNLPSKEVIEEFYFHTRNLPTKKENIELPFEWMKELREIGIKKGLKKVELHRYIYGQFLGKVK